MLTHPTRLFSSLAIFALLLGTFHTAPTSAQVAPGAGSLVKGSTSTVYYLADDGGRYYFPNSKIYFTWYENFDSVQQITDAELATYQLKGNVSYRAGRRLIKIESDPKVYAVDTGARLRWVPSESRANSLFGSNWAQQVDDIPVSFFSDYLISEALGETESTGASYDSTSASQSTPTINDNLEKRREYRGQSNAPLPPSEDPLYQGGGGSGSGGSQNNTPTPSPTPPSATCGNGVREGTEQCDSTDLNAESCTSRGFVTGALSCSSSCTFVTSACSNVTPPPEEEEEEEENPPAPAPDTTAPAVSWVTPSAGSVSGNMTLSVTATDNVGVSSVKFQINNILITTDTTSPFSATYDTTAISNGSYTLYAVATDAAGNAATSTRSITVSNIDVIPPTVSFTAPSSGATVSGTTTISANASDNMGVFSVKFQIGSTLIVTDTSSPYATSYNTMGVSNGSHTLYAVARDTTGNYTTTTRSITVNNVSAPSEDLSGLVARYEFSAGSGSSAIDTSGNSRTGTINGASWTTGQSGNGLSFDGVNDYIEVANTAAFNLTSTLTMSAWVKPEDTSGGYRVIYSKPSSASVHSAPYASYAFGIQDMGSTFIGWFITSSNLGGLQVFQTSASYNFGEWMHIAAVHTGSSMIYYVNGTAVGSIPQSGTLHQYATPVRIGINGGLADAFRGTMDDVRVYNRALSASEIATMATGASTPSPTPEPEPEPTPTPDTTAPSVAFSAPSSGATVSGTITLSATASDNVGVSSVQFRIGSTTIVTDTTSPYSTSYNTNGVSNGTHTVYAIATDAAGNSTTASRSITVSNSVPTPPPPTGGICTDTGLAAIPSCNSASYYVDASAGSNSNPGTSASPWATVAYARAQAPTGATICLRTGNYGNFLETSPPAGNKTHVIRAQSGHTPVIADIQIDYSSLQAANITFSGITVYGSDQELITIDNAANLRFNDMHVSATKWANGGVGRDGMSIYFSSNVVVDHSEFTELHRGIQVGDTANPRIISNHIAVTTGSGIQYLPRNSNAEISYNNIHGVDPAPGDPDAVVDPHASVIEFRDGDVTVNGNHLHGMGSSSGIMFYDGDVIGNEVYNDIMIENNLIYDIDNSYGIRIYNLGSNVTFRNNIVWRGIRPGSCNGAIESAPYRYHTALTVHGRAPGSTGLNLYNNVFVGSVYTSTGDIAAEANNVVWAWGHNGAWQSTSPGGGSSTIITSSDMGCGNHNPIFENGTFFQGTVNPWFPGRDDREWQLTSSAAATYLGNASLQANRSIGALSGRFVSAGSICRGTNPHAVGAYAN